ncbi:MAG: STAS/SEC14 domain-containing protein [Deltaproteobacteria bacterium]|nr:STAS/SEC14 domain-containing protein [Deltaproteobacteria bacterium]
MFEQLTAPDHVIAVHLSGSLTGEDIKQYKSILDDKLEKYERINGCVDFTGLSDTNAEALVEGMKADLKFITHIRQFSRCAIVSDKEWPRAMISLVGPWFPTFKMKVFTPDQIDEAIIWAGELPQVQEAKSPAMRIMPTSKDNVLAFEINGVISSAEMPSFIDEFSAFINRHEKVRLLNRIKHFGGFDPAILMQKGLVAMKLAAMQKVERYAIVNAPGWMSTIIKTMNPIFPGIDIRTFPADQEADAWAWLGAEPTE